VRTDGDDAAAEAGRALARHRWGTQRVDGLIDQLEERIQDIDDCQRSRLVALAEVAQKVRRES
jgi:hypothetical protein